MHTFLHLHIARLGLRRCLHMCPVAHGCLPTPALPPSHPRFRPARCTRDRPQVEARLRQLEGKQVGGEAAKPRGLPGAEKYDSGRAAGARLNECLRQVLRLLAGRGCSGAGAGGRLGAAPRLLHLLATAGHVSASPAVAPMPRSPPQPCCPPSAGAGGGALLGQAKAYNADADVAMEDGEKKKKKKKKDKEAAAEEPAAAAEDGEKKKKKKKRAAEEEAAADGAAEGEKKKKKKKKDKGDA